VHLVGFIERVDALIAEASVFVMSSRVGGIRQRHPKTRSPSAGRLWRRRREGFPEVLPAEVLVPPGAAEPWRTDSE
jgi:hypothetical protein